MAPSQQGTALAGQQGERGVARHTRLPPHLASTGSLRHRRLDAAGRQQIQHKQCNCCALAAVACQRARPPAPLVARPLQQTFIDAVVKRLMSDAPLAILLSGGLDSSLVASVAVRGAQGGKGVPAARGEAAGSRKDS